MYFAYQLVGILAGHLLDLCWFYVVLQVKSADVPFSEVYQRAKRLLGNSQWMAQAISLLAINLSSITTCDVPLI